MQDIDFQAANGSTAGIADYSGLSIPARSPEPARASDWNLSLIPPTGLNYSLPIYEKADEILAALEHSRKAIVVSPTGSGKSTELPNLLVNKGLRVVCTEPRIIAARSLATWTAHCRNERLGDLVGYRTSEERCCSEKTRLTYCTDGLQVVKELMGHAHKERDILIIDEFHERNLNQDILLAWVKHKLLHSANFRVMIMSATIDAEKISAFLGNAPVVEAQGRLHPITERERGDSLQADVVNLMSEGKHVLVFQPGKYEIDECCSKLYPLLKEKFGAQNFNVLKLHSELSLHDQMACFTDPKVPTVVVASRIAEASITIPYITAVVDRGLDRIILTKNNVQGLYTVPISMAQLLQRKGRAGRTHPGIYIYWGPVDRELLITHPISEIERLQTENLVLRVVAFSHIHPRQLEFLNSPPREELSRATRTLQSMGCLDANSKSTSIGQKIAHLPISANLGRMLVEAEGLGCLSEALIAASLIESRGIIIPDNDRWKRFCTDENSSDLSAQIKVFKAVKDKTAAHDIMELEGDGISYKKLKRTKEHLKHLSDRYKPGRDYQACKAHQAENRLTASFLKGFPDNIYVKTYKGWTNQQRGVIRRLPLNSVVSLGSEFIAGAPFDFKREHDGEKKTSHTISWASCVPENLLSSRAIQLQKLLARKSNKREKKQGERPSHRQRRWSGNEKGRRAR